MGSRRSSRSHERPHRLDHAIDVGVGEPYVQRKRQQLLVQALGHGQRIGVEACKRRVVVVGNEVHPGLDIVTGQVLQQSVTTSVEHAHRANEGEYAVDIAGDRFEARYAFQSVEVTMEQCALLGPNVLEPIELCETDGGIDVREMRADARRGCFVIPRLRLGLASPRVA